MKHSLQARLTKLLIIVSTIIIFAATALSAAGSQDAELRKTMLDFVAHVGSAKIFSMDYESLNEYTAELEKGEPILRIDFYDLSGNKLNSNSVNADISDALEMSRKCFYNKQGEKVELGSVTVWFNTDSSEPDETGESNAGSGAETLSNKDSAPDYEDYSDYPVSNNSYLYKTSYFIGIGNTEAEYAAALMLKSKIESYQSYYAVSIERYDDAQELVMDAAKGEIDIILKEMGKEAVRAFMKEHSDYIEQFSIVMPQIYNGVLSTPFSGLNYISDLNDYAYKFDNTIIADENCGMSEENILNSMGLKGYEVLMMPNEKIERTFERAAEQGESLLLYGKSHTKLSARFNLKPLRYGRETDVYALASYDQKYEHNIPYALVRGMSFSKGLSDKLLKELYARKGKKPEEAAKEWFAQNSDEIICQSDPYSYSPKLHEYIFMTNVKGGSFIMGSSKGYEDEIPPHKVSVDDFYISTHEITYDMWRKVYSRALDLGYGFRGIGNNSGLVYYNGGNPVTEVSWYDALKWCNALSEIEDKQPCYYNEDGSILKTGDDKVVIWKEEANGYRLPTEAEWEYAYRAGSQSVYFWGDEIDADKLWYAENSFEYTHPVMLKEPNAFGLFDMAGNVWELTWSEYRPYPFSKALQFNGSNKSKISVRGGSAMHNNWTYASARGSVHADTLKRYNGFRIAAGTNWADENFVYFPEVKKEEASDAAFKIGILFPFSRMDASFQKEAIAESLAFIDGAYNSEHIIEPVMDSSPDIISSSLQSLEKRGADIIFSFYIPAELLSPAAEGLSNAELVVVEDVAISNEHSNITLASFRHEEFIYETGAVFADYLSNDYKLYFVSTISNEKLTYYENAFKPTARAAFSNISVSNIRLDVGIENFSYTNALSNILNDSGVAIAFYGDNEESIRFCDELRSSDAAIALIDFDSTNMVEYRNNNVMLYTQNFYASLLEYMTDVYADTLKGSNSTLGSFYTMGYSEFGGAVQAAGSYDAFIFDVDTLQMSLNLQRQAAFGSLTLADGLYAANESPRYDIMAFEELSESYESNQSSINHVDLLATFFYDMLPDLYEMRLEFFKIQDKGKDPQEVMKEDIERIAEEGNKLYNMYNSFSNYMDEDSYNDFDYRMQSTSDYYMGRVERF